MVYLIQLSQNKVVGLCNFKRRVHLVLKSFYWGGYPLFGYNNGVSTPSHGALR